ncbi:MAG: hypothetical protein ABI432_11060 [Flavobacteriales bacterium]
MLGFRTLFARVVVPAALLVQAGPLCGQDPRSIEPHKQISSERAVELAERFVRDNGYTDAPDSAIKSQLDPESIELAEGRAELLKSRRNTLQPRAIGVKATDDGLGVAFDYVSHPGSCRVVTMHKDGTQIRIKHQDGIREYWLGFSER